MEKTAFYAVLSARQAGKKGDAVMFFFPARDGCIV